MTFGPGPRKCYNILSLTIRVILAPVGNRWTIVNFSWNPIAIGIVVANIADSIAISVFLMMGGIINSLRWRFGVKLIISIFDENLARVWQCWAIVEKRKEAFGFPLIVRKSVPWRFNVEEEDSEERRCQVFLIEQQLNNCNLQ